MSTLNDATDGMLQTEGGDCGATAVRSDAALRNAIVSSAVRTAMRADSSGGIVIRAAQTRTATQLSTPRTATRSVSPVRSVSQPVCQPISSVDDPIHPFITLGL